MSIAFKWKKLLNEDRITPGKRDGKSDNDKRNEFQNDYDRIACSSSLRRLQDKAQVFPLEKYDFVRTRLTHSLEVSSLAKSLGLSVGKIIKEDKLETDFDDNMIYKLSSVLVCAGLVHDIGNPPFGHFGETAIRGWFKNNLDTMKYKNKHLSCILNDQQVNDFLNFEGNAQSLRLLTKLHFVIDEHGMNLTYGVLSSIIKYPRSSVEINEDKGVSFKKMGYYFSEKETFNEIIRNTNGIAESISRNPLAFLLEAADDIAYKAADIEDGYKKGKLSYEDIELALCELIEKEKESVEEEIKLHKSLLGYYEEAKNLRYNNPGFYAVQRFRIRVQGFMMSAVTKAFIDNYTSIMQGDFEKELLKVSSAHRISKMLGTLAYKHIFTSSDILTLEVAGDKIINNLLNYFVPAVLSNMEEETKTKDGKLYNLISDNYRFVNEKYSPHNGDERDYCYNRLLLATDFICGMTDSYAKELYQKLNGIDC